MLVTQELRTKFKKKLLSLLDRGYGYQLDINGHEFDQATLHAFADAVGDVQVRMELSDDEELAVQALEDRVASWTNGETRAEYEPFLKVLRTRHARREVVRSPGRMLHEKFWAEMNGAGDRRYPKGCWTKLPEPRRAAWEAAGKALLQSVSDGKTTLPTKSPAPIGNTFGEAYRSIFKPCMGVVLSDK